MKVALVGLGSMGKKHHDVLSKTPQIEKVYCIDSETCGDTGVIYCNEKQLLSSAPDIDFAIIATPTFTHSSIAKSFIEAKIPLLIEKPVTRTVEEGLALLELATKNDCKVVVGHIERYNPAVCTLMESISPEEKIINCSCLRVGPYPSRITDVGVSLDLAVHDVDLLRYIVGEKMLSHNAKKTFSTSKVNDDTSSFFLQFSKNISATILAS